MAEQRIPNPRVGSSNLSTPATYKALVERLEPFSYCCFWRSNVGRTRRPPGSPARSNLSAPATFNSLRLRVPAEMLGLFCICGLSKYFHFGHKQGSRLRVPFERPEPFSYIASGEVPSIASLLLSKASKVCSGQFFEVQKETVNLSIV